MEILMPYHLLFISIAFALFFFDFYVIFINPNKERVMASWIISGFGYLLCLLNSQGFFRIGLIGSDNTVDAYIEMFPVYSLFFVMTWVFIFFIFYAYWYWVRNFKDMDKTEE